MEDFMHKDWLFTAENGICHFRIGAVLIRNNKLLVMCDNGEYALPGGHVSFGETSKETLIREIKEEISVEIDCDRLIWVEENFWKWGKKKAHNISLYYLVSLKNDADIPDDYCKKLNDNKNVSIQWLSFNEIPHVTIYPQFIKDKIGNISLGIEHFIRNDWN